MRFKSHAFSLIWLLLPISFRLLLANDIYHKGWMDANKNGKMDVYEDPFRSAEERVTDLLGRMSLDEKLAQLRSGINRDGRNIDPTNPAIGMLVHTSEYKGPAAGTEVTNRIQRRQIEKSRLGIPLIFIEEALHGLKAPESASFPQAIALAATWNPELMSRITTAIAAEARARGVRQVLSPVVDLARDPRWGRAQETYGEDPYLASRMAVAFCKPLEAAGVITTPKHFVANSGDGGRDSWAQYYTERYLYDVYFPPYIACIKEAGSRSIMPSYGSLNGLPTVAHPWLLNEVARKQWGFTGYYGSDFGAVPNVRDRHRVTTDSAEVAAMCLNAGNDVEWPRADFYGKPLREAVERGLVSMNTLDGAVARLLRVKFEIGLFEAPFGDVKQAIKTTDCDAHRALALEAARQSMVLLKNENNTLPFDPDALQSILVVGHKAKAHDLGGYSAEGMKTVSILEGLRNHLPDADVRHHHGVDASLTPFIHLPGRVMQAGWRCAYFNSATWEGAPLLVRNENAVQKGWWGSVKVDGLDKNNFGLRWTGIFEPEQSISARLHIQANGDFHVWINDEEIIGNDGGKGWIVDGPDPEGMPLAFMEDYGDRTTYGVKYSFKAGQTYAIRVDWGCQNVDRPYAHLMWDQKIGADQQIASAVEAAQTVDAIVMVPSNLGEGEFQDRPILDYPDEEEALIRALGATGKPMVAALVNGAAVTMTDWIDFTPAVLETWYSGEEGGHAIAETLLGKNNPGGKMPFTTPMITAQCPLFYNYHPIGRTRGFQDPWKGRPLFPFGHGLSYTSFAYGNLSLSPETIRPGESVTVRFDVTNIGPVAGDEVSQLYLWDEAASVVRPMRELKGFQRVSLAPGASQTIALTLTSEALSIWNKDMDFVMEPGWMTVYVGGSCEDIRLKGRFNITE